MVQMSSFLLLLSSSSLSFPTEATVGLRTVCLCHPCPPDCHSHLLKKSNRLEGWTVLASGTDGGLAGPAGEPLSSWDTALVLGSVIRLQEAVRFRRLVKLGR